MRCIHKISCTRHLYHPSITRFCSNFFFAPSRIKGIQKTQILFNFYMPQINHNVRLSGHIPKYLYFSFWQILIILKRGLYGFFNKTSSSLCSARPLTSGGAGRPTGANHFDHATCSGEANCGICQSGNLSRQYPPARKLSPPACRDVRLCS